MSDLRKAMEEYLKLRRSLGFELLKVAGILRSFVAFAEKETAFHITTDLVIRWVKLSTAKESATLADKYNTVRRFAIWRNAIEATRSHLCVQVCIVPPKVKTEFGLS